MPEEKSLSFLDRLKQKAVQQEIYGGKAKITEAKTHVNTCPNCGAGRAKEDGLTHCAYCGFEFISTELSDGIYIKKEDNSKK
ncbi:MAG: hypothetical protein LBQ84_03960 [Flavobacteriaceae bacterium]|jgi:uncharacterized Zn finger protein (UPF0148 family)|nr:hypothetical protein [Flavobacteriaceae bacterium]